MNYQDRGKGLLFLSPVFIFIGVCACASEAVGFGIFALVFGIAGVILGIYLLHRYNEAEKELQLYKDLRKELKKSLKTIINAYMLNISGRELEEILNSNDPNYEFNHSIPRGIPSEMEFCENMITKLASLIEEMKIPFDIATSIMLYARSELNSVDIEFIKEVASQHSKDMPSELYGLKDKINYETASLGIIQSYAFENSNQELIDKVTRLRIVRGYFEPFKK